MYLLTTWVKLHLVCRGRSEYMETNLGLGSSDLFLECGAVNRLPHSCLDAAHAYLAVIGRLVLGGRGCILVLNVLLTMEVNGCEIFKFVFRISHHLTPQMHVAGLTQPLTG